MYPCEGTNPMRRILLTAAMLGVTTFGSAGLEAQTDISARGATLRIGGRLQSQYWTSFVDGSDSDFFIRRARLSIDMTFTDFVTGKLLADFSSGQAKPLDAYVRLNFSNTFRVSFGQFKRSFDLFELSSSTDLSLIERTGKIGGYDNCAGVGRLCSYSRVTEGLMLSGRDTGIKFDGSSGRVSYQATVTNGTAIGTTDVNDGKSFAGRASFMARDDVQLSGNLTVKDYLDPSDETAYAFAWGGDVQVGMWRDGILLQVAVVSGDNWQSLDPTSQAPGTFTAGQVAISYYFPIQNDRIIGIEPIGRVSVVNPDDTQLDVNGTLVTPGLMFYFLGKNKFGFNYDYYLPQGGDAVSTFRFGTFLYF